METNDDFDRILEMNTEAERRMFAAIIMAGLIANPTYSRNSSQNYARRAIEHTDALIAELNKKKDGNN